MLVRLLGADDRDWKEGALRLAWGSTTIARKGELVDVVELPGFVAIADEQRVGLVIYAVRNHELEIVTIQAEPEGRGVGRALMDAVLGHARDEGIHRIWLITTNDNVRALSFYQQWGMDLVALIRDGVSTSRNVKPSIPTIARNGIPIRHELELELHLHPD